MGRGRVDRDRERWDRAHRARWDGTVRRVVAQIGRVSEVDEAEAYMICCAHAKVLAGILGRRARLEGVGLEEGIRGFWEAFIGDAIAAYEGEED